MADTNTDHTQPVHVVGPYAVYGRLAAGGMATVHLGRIVTPESERRTVAIKRLHPQFAKDPEFVAMFIDEAKLAARIKHANVVDTLDILTMGQELLLVMEYIRGECFSKLLRAARRKNLHPSVPVVASICAGMLRGLHAAHDTRGENGELLNVVHRDVSPQNVMIGVDGVAKVLDFGVAKASARIQITRDGQMKGKLSYMSPEQLQGMPVDRRADVFACGVVLWEALTRRRLFTGDEAGEVLTKILQEEVPAPSTLAPELSPELDAVVLRALHKDNTQRYQTAEELAEDLERVVSVASPQEVGAWIQSVAGEILGKRARLLAEIESSPLAEETLKYAQSSAAEAFSSAEGFEELQSWAEREAARAVAADAGSAVATEPEVGAHNYHGFPAPNDEDHSAVTVAVPAEAAAGAGRRRTNTVQPVTSSAPSVATRPSRWVLLVAIVTGALGAGGVLLLRMGDSAGRRVAVTQRSAHSLRPGAEKAAVPEGLVQRSEPGHGRPESGGQAAAAIPVDKLVPTIERKVAASTASLRAVKEPKSRRGGPAAGPSVAKASLRSGSAQTSVPRKRVEPRVQPKPATRTRIPVVQSPKKATGRRDRIVPTVDCSTPYWVDAKGIRRLKVACL